MYSDNPYNDYNAHEAEQERLLEECPVCEICGEYIQDSFYYNVDGTIMCESCMNEEYRVVV